MTTTIQERRAADDAREAEVRAIVEPELQLWAEKYGSLPDGSINPRALLAGAEFIGTRFGAAVDEIGEMCSSWDVYPHMHPRKIAGCGVDRWKRIDAWVMPWRVGERFEATTIHDHGLSHAGIYVLRGVVSEMFYEVEPREWKIALQMHAPVKFRRRRHRILGPGSGVLVKVPHIHRMFNHREPGWSLHLYSSPPLIEQTSYTISGTFLTPDGSWSETEQGDCS